MNIEQAVASHYAHGSLGVAILNALAQAGKDVHHLSVKDLAPVDEFHIGGRPATVEFAAQLNLRTGMKLLDIGCGLGGTARFMVDAHGCQVTGIDLSEEYVGVATLLADRAQLGDRVAYRQASALELPFADSSFDGAYMCHVGMNIEDKAGLFREVRRVLRPAAVFGIYDVMRMGPGELSYPVPWASDVATSFVLDSAGYKQLLAGAGFEVMQERDRRDFALAAFQQMRAKAASAGPSPLGLHIVMGQNAGQKVRNMIANVTDGLITPTELICRAS